MSNTALSQKSTRLIIAGLFAVVLLNVTFFYFFEHSSGGEFESSLENLAATVPGGNEQDPNKPALDKITKSVYRPYYDDRRNGFVVVTRLPGAVWDDKDKQTLKFREMFTHQEEENIKIHEISPYLGDLLADDVWGTLQKSKQLGKKDAAKDEASKKKSNPIVEYSDFQNTFKIFFLNVMKHIEENKPSIKGINNEEHYKQAKEENRYQNKDGKAPTYGGHYRESYKNEPVRTKEYLDYFFRLSDDETRSLKSAHDKYLLVMSRKIPENLLEFGLKVGFMKGNGIMYLGGGKYNQLVLTSLSVLRSLGSVLPVEVIMPKNSDFNIDLCTNVFPRLNAKCVVIEGLVSPEIMKKINGYQLKNLALLVSSFKNVLYLDADNIPIKNPDILFVNEPFKSSRMVMWPDLWRRSTSPKFYEITGIDVDRSTQERNSYFEGDGRGKSSDPNLISYHDLKGAIPEASSETGQMMIDKEKHFSTLILSMYYNFYGPDFYYPLLTQGAAGEGDKETFIAAAHKLGLPYYQVNEFNREFGPVGKNKKREYFGMGQYDPIVDYLQSTDPDRRQKPQNEYAADQQDESKSNYDFHFFKSSSLMFMHANWPKYYISEMFERNSFGRGPKDGDNKRRRLYTDYILKETGNFDIELQIMKHIEQWVCDSKISVNSVPNAGSEERKKICQEITAQIDFLVGG